MTQVFFLLFSLALPSFYMGNFCGAGVFGLDHSVPALRCQLTLIKQANLLNLTLIAENRIIILVLLMLYIIAEYLLNHLLYDNSESYD